MRIDYSLLLRHSTPLLIHLEGLEGTNRRGHTKLENPSGRGLGSSQMPLRLVPQAGLLREFEVIASMEELTPSNSSLDGMSTLRRTPLLPVHWKAPQRHVSLGSS